MRASTKKTLTSKVASTTAVPAAKVTTTKTNGAAKGAAPTKTPATKPTAAAPVAAPPRWVFPEVPNGFTPPGAAVVRRRSKPTEQMRVEGADFAAELRTGTTYVEDFGKRAPEPLSLADQIDIAVQWDAVYDAAAPVAEYALAMRSAAWDTALKPATKLKAAFESAVADEPSLAKTWRQTAAFFGAREEPAQRAVATKAKAKKAAKKQAKAAASASPPKS